MDMTTKFEEENMDYKELAEISYPEDLIRQIADIAEALTKAYKTSESVYFHAPALPLEIFGTPLDVWLIFDETSESYLVHFGKVE